MREAARNGVYRTPFPPELARLHVAPLFEIMGSKAVHCGGSGAGQAAKICNNMILGITMIGTCEAFALADKLGLDLV